MLRSVSSLREKFESNTTEKRHDRNGRNVDLTREDQQDIQDKRTMQRHKTFLDIKNNATNATSKQAEYLEYGNSKDVEKTGNSLRRHQSLEYKPTGRKEFHGDARSASADRDEFTDDRDGRIGFNESNQSGTETHCFSLRTPPYISRTYGSRKGSYYNYLEQRHYRYNPSSLFEDDSYQYKKDRLKPVSNAVFNPNQNLEFGSSNDRKPFSATITGVTYPTRKSRSSMRHVMIMNDAHRKIDDKLNHTLKSEDQFKYSAEKKEKVEEKSLLQNDERSQIKQDKNESKLTEVNDSDDEMYSISYLKKYWRNQSNKNISGREQKKGKQDETHMTKVYTPAKRNSQEENVVDSDKYPGIPFYDENKMKKKQVLPKNSSFESFTSSTNECKVRPSSAPVASKNELKISANQDKKIKKGTKKKRRKYSKPEKFGYDLHGRRILLRNDGSNIPVRYFDGDYVRSLSVGNSIEDLHSLDLNDSWTVTGKNMFSSRSNSAPAVDANSGRDYLVDAYPKDSIENNSEEEMIQQQLLDGMFKYAEQKYGRKRPQRGGEKQNAMEDYDLYLRSLKAKVKTTSDKLKTVLKQKKDIDAKVAAAEKEQNVQQDKLDKAEEEKQNAINEGREPVLPKDFIVPKRANTGLGALAMKASSQMWEDKFTAMRSKKKDSNTPEWMAKQKKSDKASAILTVGKNKSEKKESAPKFAKTLNKTGTGGRRRRGQEEEPPIPFKVDLKKRGLRKEEEENIRPSTKKIEAPPPKQEEAEEEDEEEDRPRRRRGRARVDSDEE